MISIVLYGRNDSHGYNLHKRVALSLNCMAELLTDDDDEILFVDYNTPDDFPTFPEAIQDTLTRKAKEKLRILRLRPRIHARYQERTHLNALEPVARNVAVRRSNPSNRWILSTNTDMIFVPRTNSSLSEIVADLPGGFYGLPRFEIPESLWESFDRIDARGTIEKVRHWGMAAHLNEIVYGAREILYDGPGDFQLIERKDLFSIHGFDEEMLLGWHVDSNISKRLYLIYGRVSSLVDKLFGYLCDHTRQVTLVHRRDRIQNDSQRFYDQVTRSDLPNQADSWGCSNDPIEEIQIPVGGVTRYETMLFRVLEPAKWSTTEVSYSANSYDGYWYEASHVLPYITDLIAAQPRSMRIAWFGVRRDTFDLFRRAVAELGFKEPLLVPERFKERLGITGDLNVDVVSGSRILDRADFFFLEFGLIRDETGKHRRYDRHIKPTETEMSALHAVREGFHFAVAHERERLLMSEFSPRRFVAINCINNAFEQLIQSSIGITFTPFSSRTRHGFVVGDEAVHRSASVIGTDLAKQLARSQRINEGDLLVVRRLALQLREGVPLSAQDRDSIVVMNEILLAFLDHPASTQVFGSDFKVRERIKRQIRELARPHPGFADSPIMTVDRFNPQTPRPLSRLASTADWDDPDWLYWAEMISNDVNASSMIVRTDWIWARAQVLYGLERLGMLDRTSITLGISAYGEPLFAKLADHVGQTNVVNVRFLDRWKFIRPRSAAYWCRSKYVAGQVRIMRRAALKKLAATPHILVVIPHSTAFLSGVSGFFALLRRIDPWLAEGAIVAVSGNILLSDRQNINQPTVTTSGTNGFPEILAAHTGFAPVDMMNLQILRGDQVRVAEVKRVQSVPMFSRAWWHQRIRLFIGRPPRPTQPTLGTFDDSGLHWPAVWFFRKHRQTSDAGWVSAIKAWSQRSDR
jgi:hypothetical protein